MTNVIGKVGRSATGSPKIPLRLRLKAWWEGMDLEVCDPGTEAAEEAEAVVAEPDESPRQDWETDRVVLLQELWGEGFSSPGDERFIQKLLAPFGLNESMAVLDLGAGLGGSTRVIGRAGVSRASGLESDPDLAQAGMEISKAARMSSAAPITPFPEDGFAPKRNAYDCIFSKEFFFGIEDKESLLAALWESLTEAGQVQIVDYVAANADMDSSLLEQWSSLEHKNPFLWTRERYNDTFESLGFRVLMANDISEEISDLVSQALSDYLENVRDSSQSPSMLETMAREIHIWESRMRLLKEDHIRVFRFHIKKNKNKVG